jgi:hypothetical protein
MHDSLGSTTTCVEGQEVVATRADSPSGATRSRRPMPCSGCAAAKGHAARDATSCVGVPWEGVCARERVLCTVATAHHEHFCACMLTDTQHPQGLCLHVDMQHLQGLCVHASPLSVPNMHVLVATMCFVVCVCVCLTLSKMFAWRYTMALHP